MPYDTITQLPASIRASLPDDALKIYRTAYNAAWNEYADADKRRDDRDRQATAHRVAWDAVRQKYENRDGRWTKSSE
jgi:cation transport regulator